MDTRLQKALEETYRKYGKEHVYEAAKDALCDNNFLGLINTGRKLLRDNVIAAVKNREIDIEKEFLTSYIYNVLRSRTRKNSLEEAVYQTYRKYEEQNFNGLQSAFECLRDYIKGNNHFSRDNLVRYDLDIASYEYEDIIRLILEGTLEPLIQEIEKEKTNPITNIMVNAQNMARVAEKKITGLTHDVGGSIDLSGMNATVDIGKVKENQEDAVLLKVHPKIPEFKILVVSDGVGGAERGEVASHEVVGKISEWFGNIPDIYYNDTEKLKIELNKKIKEIDAEISRRYGGKAQATIVCAIVGREKTLIANVGDSRAYGVKNGKLTQFTRDDSLAQRLYDEKSIANKDDMRFHRKSNMITEAIGSSSGVRPNLYIIDNICYDQLLLFSDGVTDCLSDSQILAITKNTPRKELSKRIVETALKNESNIRRELFRNPDYYRKIPGGKDNTTAAVYERE